MTNQRVRRVGVTALAALAMSLAAGCSTDEVLSVNDPDVVRPESLDDVANLPVYLSSAYAEVLGGYDGGSFEGLVNMSGLLADEFIQTESFPTRFEVDTRNMLVGNSTLVNSLPRAVARARRGGARRAQVRGARAA